MGDRSHSMTTTASAPDFHGILGITKAASIRDVCKAYKNLVMRWHPDKSQSHKSEAEAKIKAITDAYEENGSGRGFKRDDHRSIDNLFPSVPTFLSKSTSRRSQTPTLSKSMSRRDTNQTSSPPFLSNSMSRRCATPTPSHPSLSKSASRRCTTPSPSPPSLSKSTSRRSTTPIMFSYSTARRKPPPIEKQLECTLEELCHGCVKKIEITRDVVTDTGMIVKEEELLRIKVKPGWRRGTKITFEGMGDERPGTLPADIIFLIAEKPHPLFKREDDDLVLTIEIPLMKALTGSNLSIPLLSKEKMNLLFDDIIYPGYEKIIAGQGMPNPKEQGRRGALRIKFRVNFPRQLSDEQRSDIRSLLEDSS